jgi:hypothetical protein
VLFTFITPMFERGNMSPAEPADYRIESLSKDRAIACTRRRRDGGEDLVVVNPDERSLQLSDGTALDARFAFLRRSPSGAVERAFIAGRGKHLTTGDCDLYSAPDAGYAYCAAHALPHDRAGTPQT